MIKVPGKRRMSFISGLDLVQEEIEIMKKMDNPNIIKLYEVIDDPNYDKMYLVLELAEAGQLMEFEPQSHKFKPNPLLLMQSKSLRNDHTNQSHFDEELIRKVARGLLNSLDYLHNVCNIVHRDIKP